MSDPTPAEDAPAPVRAWTVEMSVGDGNQCLDQWSESVEAANLEDAVKAAKTRIREFIIEAYSDYHDFYLKRGFYHEDDPDGRRDAWIPVVDIYEARWELFAGGGDDRTPLVEDDDRVAIELDHNAVIRAVGGNPDCDHDWEAFDPRGEGAAVINGDRCRRCGLERWDRTDFSNGRVETVRYRQPDHWCPKCQVEEEHYGECEDDAGHERADDDPSSSLDHGPEDRT